MDFRLTEEQELLLASVREMMQRDFPDEYFRKCDLDRRFPRGSAAPDWRWRCDPGDRGR